MWASSGAERSAKAADQCGSVWNLDLGRDWRRSHHRQLHRDVLENWSKIETKVALMIGEIGGPQKWTRIFAKEHEQTLIAYIAGLTAPPGRRMGHAGAIISTAARAPGKSRTPEELGVTICPTPALMGQTVAKYWSSLGLSENSDRSEETWLSWF